MQQAAIVGLQRSIENINDPHSVDKWPCSDKDRFGQDINGCLAEYAVAKLLDVCWSPNVFRNRLFGDVGKLEVKSSCHVDSALRVHAANVKRGGGSFASTRYVLVITAAPLYHVVGWAFGAEIAQPKHHRRGPNGESYFVEQHKLHPIQSLMEEFGNRRITRAEEGTA